MKKLIILFTGMLISFTIYADTVSDTLRTTVKIDSLEHILYDALNYNLSSKDKINICLQLADLYSPKSHEKQVEYGARSLILSEELGDNQLIVPSLKILANGYFKLDKYEKSIEYNTRLYNINNSENNEIEAAQALVNIGRSYFGWSKYPEAKDYYERALDIYKKNQYFEGVATALRGIANVLGHWGEYEEALTYNQEALNFWEEIGNEEEIAASYNNMGMLYLELGNCDNAFDYFNKSLDIYQRLGSSSDILNLTLHLGDIYLQQQQYNKALEYYIKAQDIGKEVNNKKLKSIILSNIGEAYNKKGDYNKALQYQNQALKLKEEIGDKRRLSITYTELGSIYNNIGEYDKALFYLNKGLDAATEISFKYQLNKCYKNLSDVYKNIGNYKKAYDFFQLYISGKEKINSEDSKQKIAELQAKYQVEKKDKENERLRHSELLNKVQIRNQQLIIGFVLFILLGSFILSIVFHSRYQQNQKLNIQLSLKNKEIEEQQKNVEKLNTDLQESNAAKDKFFSIVAHDLKNPFNSLLVLTGLLIDDYDTLTEEERKQFIDQIKNSAENTYMLLQNLLEWASTQLGKTVIVKENIDISRISNEVITILRPIAKNKKITIGSDIPEKTFAFADKNMISTIFLNLLSNAVKFTPRDGEVRVRSIASNAHLEIQVADSGVGISSDNIKKLFRLDQKLQTAGTDKEKGTGLGLILCKEFVDKNNGKIWVESEEGKGSSFFFSLPV